MDGDSFSKSEYCLSAARILCKPLQRFHGIIRLKFQERCSCMVQYCQGAAVTLIRGIKVVRT
eukprot:5976010-Pyramimonas_sp.AAC.1